MKRQLTYLFIISIPFFLLSCNNRGERQQQEPLSKLNWSEKNYRALCQLITDYGNNSKLYNKAKAPYAVLDWDQTCAHFDVEEAMMRYQMFHLKYKLTKEQFAGLLRNEINGVTKLSETYQQIALKDINQDLINDYNFLYDKFIGIKSTMTYEEIKNTLQYQDFIVKIPFLYSAYSETPGIGEEYGYPWLLYLFSGYTINEVKDIASDAISFELSNQLTQQTIKSPANLPSKTGILKYTYKSGLRIFPEMLDLISTFKKYGIDVFIVSASFKPVVEVFSGEDRFGYNISPDHIIAMELATDNSGKILPEYKTGWVKTFRNGKVEAIEKVIKIGLQKNWDPVFSAGDSDGDYEMLIKFPNTKLSLIWNRSKGGDIGKLCKQAINQENSKYPRYILQGRNENTGILRTNSSSILFGKIEPELIY
ncbi:MAG: haloacid dehalogenase-like hydrolase [Marinilabiliales bacterium]|nr:haloacid dehalogenase-like hydrolase [Marinilabiliales bacterium]